MTETNASQIRVAHIDDLPEIIKIEQLAGFNPRSSSHLRHSLQHHQLWIIETDAIISGFAVFQTVLDETELLNIVISPEKQGRQLGRALLTFCLQSLHNQGVNKCFLEVGESNVAAQSLYNKLGFDAIARRKDYYQLASGKQDALIFEYRFNT